MKPFQMNALLALDGFNFNQPPTVRITKNDVHAIVQKNLPKAIVRIEPTDNNGTMRVSVYVDGTRTAPVKEALVSAASMKELQDECINHLAKNGKLEILSKELNKKMRTASPEQKGAIKNLLSELQATNKPRAWRSGAARDWLNGFFAINSATIGVATGIAIAIALAPVTFGGSIVVGVAVGLIVAYVWYETTTTIAGTNEPTRKRVHPSTVDSSLVTTGSSRQQLK
jgi:hypothetical protein